MLDPRAATTTASAATGENQLLHKEMRLWCLQGLLLCLERKQRLAFILGTVLEMPGAEAADLMQIPPATFRKRLSRARSQLHGFMKRHCGLVRQSNPCHCADQLPATISAGLINPDGLLFATHPVRARYTNAAAELVQDMDELGVLSSLFRDCPDYAAPESVFQNLKITLEGGRSDEHTTGT